MPSPSSTQLPQEKILLTKRDVAFALSVSLRTVDNLMAAGELVTRRVGRRRLIPRSALEQFARRDHPTRPKGQGGAE